MPTGLAEVKTGQALRLLAFKCGLVRGTRKSDTLLGLQRIAKQHKTLQSDARVLSIDMGIKNFAFTLLTPSTPSTALEKNGRATVHAWRNMPLQFGLPDSLVHENDGIDATTKSHIHDDAAVATPTSGSYTPLAMAQTASLLVSRHLLPLKPTHVLIERQRSRSGGSAAVAEWTLRINILEGMLYALFTDLKARGHWDGELVPVVPKQVLPFSVNEFLQDNVMNPDVTAIDDNAARARHHMVVRALVEATTTKKGQASYKETKKHKVDMIGTMLDRGEEVVFEGDEVTELEDRFLDQWRNTTKLGGRKRRANGKQLKLDDLADSLLQGLTWMKWQANRDVLASDDVSPLLAPYSAGIKE